MNKSGLNKLLRTNSGQEDSDDNVDDDVVSMIMILEIDDDYNEGKYNLRIFNDK